jgi:hypothetical protein
MIIIGATPVFDNKYSELHQVRTDLLSHITRKAVTDTMRGMALNTIFFISFLVLAVAFLYGLFSITAIDNEKISLVSLLWWPLFLSLLGIEMVILLFAVALTR